MKKLTVEHDELKETLNLLAELPADHWHGWVIYLLQSLEKIAAERGESDIYDEVLGKIGDNIMARLVVGRW